MDENELKELIKEYEKYIDECLKKINVYSSYVTIYKCKSCDSYYAQGFVCSCGRDNSYSNEEWENRNKVEG